MFQFSYRFAFYQRFDVLFFKLDAENNANFDPVPSKRGKFDAVQ